MFWLLAAFLGGGMGALNAPSAQAFAPVIIFMVAATFSILVHEFGHALTGLKLGAHAAEIQLHGMGGLASFPGGRFTAKNRILMTAAGPGASLALAFVFGVVSSFVIGDQRPATMQEAYFVYFVTVMVKINLFWSAINLMPVIPLDGGQIVMAFLGPQRLKTTCIISFLTVALLAFVLWMLTRSIFNMLIMAFLASHTMQVWQAMKQR